MSSQPTMPSTGSVSDDFLKGEFSILAGLTDWIDGFDEELAAAIANAVDGLRISIRQEASQTPGWKQFEDILDVTFEGGEFHYILTGDADKVQAAYDLEFGTPNRPPRSLIRKVGLRTKPISDSIREDLSKGVPVA